MAEDILDAEAGKKTVRDFLEKLHAGETEAALAFTTGNPDFLIFNNPFPGGTRAFSGIAKGLFTQGPTREYIAQFVDGDTVITQMTVRGTTIKGEEYENHYIVVCTFAGDKIDRLQEYMDSAYANTRFGMG
jgi:ketosteroid isomerase-like protein